MVTFVTHNSRVSERMVTYGIVGKYPLIFTPDDQIFIAEKLVETWGKYAIKVVACNVLPDHVHLVMAAPNETELSEQVKKMKGYTSYEFQRNRVLENKGPIWAQKYHDRRVRSENSLQDIINYVVYNHLKHVDRWGEGLLLTWGDELALKQDKGLKSPLEGNKGFQPLVSNRKTLSSILSAGYVSVEEASTRE